MSRWSICLLLALASCDERAAPAAPARAPLTEDPRVALLFDPTLARGGYDVDLSDPLAVHVATLQIGEHEPLRRAKMELAESGERGVEAVGRLIERFRSDPAGTDYLRNAVDVLSLSAEPAATLQLESLLGHPSESLRMQVLRGLLVHPRARSYDRVLQALAEAPLGYQAEVCAALGKVDPPRAQRLWLSWIENGDNPQLWPQILPALAATRDPELCAKAGKLLERGDLDPQTRIWLAAASASAGDRPHDRPREEAALAELRKSRESKNPTERDLAVRALLAAEQFGELSWSLAHEESESVRTLIVAAAAASTRPEARALLEQAANDAAPNVRMAALTALADSGSGAAVDEALQWMQSPAPAEVEAGIRILRQRMEKDPALAQRVWNLLGPRLATLDVRPPVEQAMLIKVLGQVPSPEGTRALLQLALARKDTLEATRAQRFILLQSVNAGVGAQDALYELWRKSDDELTRLDAIEAFSALGGAHSRELLVQVLDDPRTTPVEIVYVADRLVRIGPASEVAWQLKRKSFALQDARAREALQGILWRWYPAPPRERR